MRIVGGILGGRRFDSPVAAGVRPTSERVREAIASALDARQAIEGATVLDLFTGTGALAFEALSRGARDAILVDRDRRVLRAIEKGAHSLGLRDRVTPIALDLFRNPDAVAKKLAAAAPKRFDLVFVDPPYAEIERVPALLAGLLRHGCIAPEAWIAIERAFRSQPLVFDDFELCAGYRHGDTETWIIQPRLRRDVDPGV